MPSTSFSKAPLKEIISEVRWNPGATVVSAPIRQGVAQPFVHLANARVEEFFMRLGGELYQSGFQRSERLIPPGFPTIPGQVVFRYRSNNTPQKSVLYQVGPGVFSINGVPPYRSWDEFSPSVRSGIHALLKSRPPEQNNQPFLQVSLRYIDFFGDELMQGMPPATFISDVLGISTKLPANFNKLVKPDGVPSVFSRVILPLEIGTLTFSIGDGKINNQSGVVMDTTVISKGPSSPDLTAIMSLLDNAHKITNDLFMDLTNSIHKIMEPVRQ